jgi:hypothetical protein
MQLAQIALPEISAGGRRAPSADDHAAARTYSSVLAAAPFSESPHIADDVSCFPTEAARDTLLVNQITEQVRARIQEGLDRNLARRRSMFW